MEIRDKNGKTLEEFLKDYQPKEYPSSFLTADLVIFKRQQGKWFLLLIQRGNHPCLGKWACPGGFVNPNEDAVTAAARELEEETHIKGLFLQSLGLFSTPGRDPRFWVVSESFLSVMEEEQQIQADDDAKDAGWFALNVEKEKQEYQVKLDDKNIHLDFSFQIKEEKNLLGTQKMVQIKEAGNLAFDHNEMIARGILKLEEAGLL